MTRLLSQDAVDEYLGNDVILQMLDEHSQDSDEAFTTQQWLRQSDPKRYIYREVYGDLLKRAQPDLRVLDVGGGYNALTRLLARHVDYTLLDIMCHDSCESVRAVEREEGCEFLAPSDWLDFHKQAGEYDIIIANDLFPNVDQRLDLFLELYAPKCAELRLVLTYYNTPRWYEVKRMDGEEVFHMMAWSGKITQDALMPHLAESDHQTLSAMLENPPSLYANGRQVCLTRIPGNLVKSPNLHPNSGTRD